MTHPDYQERVKKRILSESQPDIETYEPSQPHSLPDDPLFEHLESSLSRWGRALLIVLIAIMTFSMVEAYLTIAGLFQTHPVLGGLLSVALGGVVLTLSALIIKEWQAVRQLNKWSSSAPSIAELKAKGERAHTLAAIQIRAQNVAPKSWANQYYQTFVQTVKPHHTNDEILQIYKDKVQTPLLKQAKSVLQQESIGAGAVAFMSPNSLLQTLGLLWMSMRTLKRIAFVYGVRPSLIGNLKLFRMALENLAASSLMDLATDELANQLGGTIGDKLLANSADAITAASLNQKLGKALIKVLS